VVEAPETPVAVPVVEVATIPVVVPAIPVVVPVVPVAAPVAPAVTAPEVVAAPVDGAQPASIFWIRDGPVW